jgi:predicted acylesterase/phospholipase RssA
MHVVVVVVVFVVVKEVHITFNVVVRSYTNGVVNVVVNVVVVVVGGGRHVVRSYTLDQVIRPDNINIFVDGWCTNNVNVLVTSTTNNINDVPVSHTQAVRIGHANNRRAAAVVRVCIVGYNTNSTLDVRYNG